jgi:hypothetical protein
MADLIDIICARKIKLNRFSVFGGNGGRKSFNGFFSVLFRLEGRDLLFINDRCSYFCLINRFIAGSISLASISMKA